MQEEFSGATLRLYTNDDMVGSRTRRRGEKCDRYRGGSLRRTGTGANTIAALVTRGLAEMTRLAVGLGGAPRHSGGPRRARRSGSHGDGHAQPQSLGRCRTRQGRPLAEILGGMRMVAEGVGTTAATLALARKHGVEMPITEQMHAVLNQGRAPRDAIRELMERRLKQ